MSEIACYQQLLTSVQRNMLGMNKAVAVVALILFGIAAFGQSQTLQRFADSNFGFELSYPPTYEVTDLPCAIAQWAASHGYQSLLYVRRGHSQNAGSIHVTVDRRQFSVDNLMQLHSRADEQPTMVKVGKNVFYYYGRGGGGVSYPDEYFYNLDGNILGISFDGPYPPHDNSPTAQTKAMERRVLESFRRIEGTPKN
jgi:hypothetical protein